MYSSLSYYADSIAHWFMVVRWEFYTKINSSTETKHHTTGEQWQRFVVCGAFAAAGTLDVVAGCCVHIIY